MKQKVKGIFSKYRHAWILSYFFLYMGWFVYLEGRTNVEHAAIHSRLDDFIPFCEYFIIPYLLWFLYIAVAIAYFLFTDKENYYKCCAFLFIGMTICLTIYTFFPNQQNLRPTQFSNESIFTKLVQLIYNSDTCTNVCPSIHVFNSIGVHIAIWKSNRLRKKTWLQFSSGLLAFSICLSTVFLKQHSIVDGVCAILLAIVMYVLVYKMDYKKLFHREKNLINKIKEDVLPSKKAKEL
ncbi:MAG: phosphatase PAP2 family protein [Lachnospiraceae bacterium]|nr:phosphatase PAP2 family protein [Lachnospiraceae bacterium]